MSDRIEKTSDFEFRPIGQGVQDIPAINHDWADTTYNFAADGKSCTATRVCNNDADHVETATATIASKADKIMLR